MIVSSSRLLGSAVVNARGEPIGHVEGIVVDLASGRIAHALVSHGGVLGLGVRRCEVEWHELRLDPDGWLFRLERSLESLAGNAA